MLAAVATFAFGRLDAATYRVTVAPEPVDRMHQWVEFPLPSDAREPFSLRDANGHAIALQASAGMASFLVTRQAAGETLSFSLVTGEPPPIRAPGVQAVPEPGALRIDVAGTPAITYRMDKEDLPRPDIRPEYKRAGYLHPVRTPTGAIVTDDYPAQHVHHHGIWAPWTKTEFQGRTPDFWNMGDKTGTVEFVALDRSWSGPVHGGFSARHRFVDLSATPEPVVALHETWVLVAFAPLAQEPPAHVFDLTITQTCATDDPLVLPTYRYGGLGFRGRENWLGTDACQVLTSEGETDRVKAHTTRVRWISIYGESPNGIVSATLLGHPDNFRAPQPLRVHPEEPFICFAPSQLGDWKIEPGKPYVARYRFVIQDGPPDPARLDAIWNAFARPARVTVTKDAASASVGSRSQP